jgi:hypothetical protein
VEVPADTVDARLALDEQGGHLKGAQRCRAQGGQCCLDRFPRNPDEQVRARRWAMKFSPLRSAVDPIDDAELDAKGKVGERLTGVVEVPEVPAPEGYDLSIDQGEFVAVVRPCPVGVERLCWAIEQGTPEGPRNEVGGRGRIWSAVPSRGVAVMRLGSKPRQDSGVGSLFWPNA